MPASLGGTRYLAEQQKFFQTWTQNSGKSRTRDGFRAIIDMARGEIFHSLNQLCSSISLQCIRGSISIQPPTGLMNLSKHQGETTNQPTSMRCNDINSHLGSATSTE